METNIRLYSLTYSEIRTYMMAALFVVCNIALPQLFHLIPQGGIIFSPLSLVIMAGAYKFGWRTGLLAALASPLVNHLLFGMPAANVMLLMAVKLSLLAVIAGLAAQYFKKVNLLILVGVVLATKALGFLVEFLFTGGVAATVQDFTVGWPGLLLMVFGTYAILKLFKN
jgi:hypothetical protein